MIKAAIFDMDGLLINSEPFWRQSERAAFRSLGVDLQDETFERFMGKRIDEVVALIYKEFSLQGPPQPEMVTRIVDGVIDLVLHEGKALDGVYQTLELLQKQGIKLALASSSQMRIINAVLEKLKIGHYFEAVHSAEFEEYGKPHPQIFLTTAKMLNVAPEDCVVFEDSFNGVIAALAANMKCIAVPDPDFGNHEKFGIAHHVLKSLSEFNLSHLEVMTNGNWRNHMESSNQKNS